MLNPRSGSYPRRPISATVSSFAAPTVAKSMSAYSRRNGGNRLLGQRSATATPPSKRSGRERSAAAAAIRSPSSTGSGRGPMPRSLLGRDLGRQPVDVDTLAPPGGTSDEEGDQGREEDHRAVAEEVTLVFDPECRVVHVDEEERDQQQGAEGAGKGDEGDSEDPLRAGRGPPGIRLPVGQQHGGDREQDHRHQLQEHRLVEEFEEAFVVAHGPPEDGEAEDDDQPDRVVGRVGPRGDA